MSILCDTEITDLCINPKTGKLLQKPMIKPFLPRAVRHWGDELLGSNPLEDADDIESVENRMISRGLSSYGYDIALGNSIEIFTNMYGTTVDPKTDISESLKSEYKHDGDFVIVPPNSFILAVSKEYIRVPRDVLVTCIGKSTYARVGLICNVTPLEPEWEGQITLEFSNTTTLPVKMYIGEGCAQLIFNRASTVCETSYKDRGGKYQGQKGITLPKV